MVLNEQAYPNGFLSGARAVLKTRIITALAVLPIVLVALFAFPNWAWDIFTLGIVLAACWEWSRFCQFEAPNKIRYFICSTLLCGAIFYAYLDGKSIVSIALIGFTVGAIFWFVIAPVWLARSARPQSYTVKTLTGWVIIFPTWLALLVLHDISPWLLLTFAVIVWVADVFAYFVGKAIGKNKLAPAISPGKTIEGALGGMAGVVLYFFLWQLLAQTETFRVETWVLQLQAQGYWLLAVFVLLGVLSVLGDLFESWMKRGANLKDSSNLLPGHGGILDRIDALTSTLPVAGLYALFLFTRFI